MKINRLEKNLWKNKERELQLLFVNSKNQIVERDIAGEEQVMGIEAVDLTETVSNVQYGPFNESIYFI